MSFGRVVSRILPVALLTLPFVSCSGSPSDSPVLTADMPLHLEDHLDAATIVGSEVWEGILQPIEWDFAEPQPGWTSGPTESWPTLDTKVAQVDGALHVKLTEENRREGDESVRGYIYVDLPELRREDWSHLLVRARTDALVEDMRIWFNLGEGRAPGGGPSPFLYMGESTPVVSDGVAQSYRIPVEPVWDEWEDPWRQLILTFSASETASIDILSIILVSKATVYGDAPVGVREVKLGNGYRRALYTHAPGRLGYRLRVPEAGRFDFGLGVFGSDTPVTFRVEAVTEAGESLVLFDEAYGDNESWRQRSVDLSEFAGQRVTLSLVTDSKTPGDIAFWGAPTVSGARTAGRPNVIFYVIDGAGADWMSVYGYNRRTTPFLERLAGEAVVFENAYSNATSTPLSAPSYMTSLLYSAIDRYRSIFDKIPDGVTTMAEHFGRVGYQTGVFVSNPFAATAKGLERSVDIVRVLDPPVPAVSSEHLQRAFWDWREAYPGTPFWAHFQTTDVHEPFRPMAPFSGLFITPELRAQYIEWDEAVQWWDSTSYAAAGITVEQHALAQQALYDEGMAHQDHHLERFVERLKAEGRWENTILVIASDHGYPAGSHRIMPGHPNDAPFIHPFATRVPLLFVWPGHIEGGRRIRTPVSMIDVLPTLLDLTGLPQPEVRQGHSLAPLLLGQVTEEEWEPRPVIVDVLVTDGISGELVGNIEVIDGRWGAALCVRPDDPEAEVRGANTGDALSDCTNIVRERLLLYDLWADPLLESPINEQRPDLVEKYTALLEAQLEANAAIRKLVGASGERVSLTPEQLQMLRTLGYIQ
jgi:arylsulfatase A-like enzyme